MRITCLALALFLASCGGPEGTSGEPSFEGRWMGDLESGLLPSGSSLIVLELDRATTGEPIAARVVFGEGEAPAAPTDPEVGWPAGLDPLADFTVPVADGFEYASSGGARTGDRVRIDLAVTELWAQWCAMQTPYPITAGTDEALCLPNRPWTASPFECHFDEDAGLPQEPVDCLKLTLCRRAPVCDCTTDGCAASASGITLYLDVLFDGDTATGSFVWSIEGGAGAGTARVQLTRQ